MNVIRAKSVDGQAVLPLEDFHRLLALARKSEPVDVQTACEDLSLVEDAEMLVTAEAGTRGSPAAVLAAAGGPPHVPAAWVDELEQLIAEGRRPPMRQNPFSEHSDVQEE